VSYSKLFKVCQDFALGFQTVNQALDNNAALYSQFDAKHSVGVAGINTGGFSNPFRVLGRHDDPLVARTTARFLVDTTTPTPTARAVVSGPMLNLSSPIYLGAGKWRLYVYTPQLFGVIAQSEATTSIDRKTTCLVEFNPSTGPSVSVGTWGISAGSWVGQNFDFSLTLWANSA
jgi:hypothetical protein